MKKLRQWLIAVISALPFARSILKGLYLLALKRARALTEQHPEIIDVLLLSNLEDKNFVYGQSSLNLVLLLEDSALPRSVLSKARKSLRQSWPANVLIDLDRLPALKESEFKTPLIRSHLATDTLNGTVVWKSVLTGGPISFTAGAQGYFAKHYSAMGKIEEYLSKDLRLGHVGKHYIRSYGKNISRALESLAKDGLLPPILDDKWKRQGKQLFSFSPFARFFYASHRARSWRLLDTERAPFSEIACDAAFYPERLIEFATELLGNDIVEDVIIAPSLLQNTEKARGKAFIDVVIGGSKKPISDQALRAVQRSIAHFQDCWSDEEAQEDQIKLDFALTTYGLLKLRHQHCLFGYPLEGWYRRIRGYSASGKVQQYETDRKALEQAMVHYLLAQFMRFRASKVSSALVGSKFMKSLNLINQYALVRDAVEERPLRLPTKYADMMARVTPQLAHYRSQTPLDPEDWPLVKSQLIYELKKIRDGLAKTRPSLRNLQF